MNARTVNAIGWGLVTLAVACAASSGEIADTPRGVTGLLIVVSGDVSPLLVDKAGHRAGWNHGRPLREIPGCAYSFGAVEEDDEGEPPASPGGGSTRAP